MTIIAKFSLALSAVLVALMAAFPALAQVPYTIIDRLQVDGETRLLNTLAVTGATTLSSTLDVTGAATFSGNATVDDVLSIDELSNTSTGAVNLTPAATYYQVSPATVLTITLQTGSATDGDLLIIHNLVATATTIVDTGATVGGGAVTLGADDLGVFIFGGGAWVEIASPDNS